MLPRAGAVTAGAGDPDLTPPGQACCSPCVRLPAITFTQYLKITFVINVQFN